MLVYLIVAKNETKSKNKRKSKRTPDSDLFIVEGGSLSWAHEEESPTICYR